MGDIYLADKYQEGPSMNISIRTPVLSMQADAYVIKNPYETKNAHTITNATDAADVLSLKSESAIDALKDMIRGCDFTSISTNELARIGSRLFELELIDEHVACAFISGSMAFDKNGLSTGRDVKFNAVAMFNQMLGDNKTYAREWPMYAHQDSFKTVTRMLLGANQAINALSYFASSDRNDLSLSIHT
ncbi:hypothetical protein [Pseudomonas baetica]|uniref:hypothetical protein n=1 Tax=Pseudomonas baetica TaxID=674054 RepID=UPI002405AA6A|nr:hypothetical protein [Pseudomonas baetica]MDF9774626.1 hypothetical protein [Pseudomonas baetica]